MASSMARKKVGDTGFEQSAESLGKTRLAWIGGRSAATESTESTEARLVQWLAECPVSLTDEQRQAIMRTIRVPELLEKLAELERNPQSVNREAI